MFKRVLKIRAFSQYTPREGCRSLNSRNFLDVLEMRDFPSCFGENGVQVADASSSGVGARKGPHNSVTCIYKCILLGKSCLISIIWSKNVIGHCLSVELDDASNRCICKVDVKPSFFSKRKGSKCFEVNGSKIEVFWDLSSAKFGFGPEPFEGYYVAVVCKRETVLVIGDLMKEAVKKTGTNSAFSNAMFISKKEHISGKRVYGTKAQFCDNGKIHDLRIDCDLSTSDDPCLLIHIDAKPVLQVKHLQWKFRGNYSILVDGVPVEVYWDVHNWLFGSCLGNAVFMFQTSLSAEKLWRSPTLPDSSDFSWSCSESFMDSKVPGVGFSFCLYAWKNE